MDIKKSFFHILLLLPSTTLLAAPRAQPEHHAAPVRRTEAHQEQHPATHETPRTPLIRVRNTALLNKQAALKNEQKRFDNFKKSGQLKPGQPMYKFMENHITQLHGEVGQAKGALDKAVAQERMKNIKLE